MTAKAVDRGGLVVLCGCILLMLVLGSVHAFSVFLEPIERQFGASRADAALTYSIALATLTVSVLFGVHVFRRLSPAALVVVVTVLSAAGAIVAGRADTLATVWLGYGVIFGAANGLGYSFALQYAAQSNPSFSGAAMGLVTAAYGMGAAVSPVPFERLVLDAGLRGGMTGLAAALGAAGLVVAAVFARTHHRLTTDTTTASGVQKPPFSHVACIWFAYGTAVAAGLMAIGHATGIARSGGVSRDWMVAAPIVIAVGNIGGSYVGGALVDRWGVRRLLRLIPAVSAAALVLLSVSSSPAVTLAGLTVVGVTYGATIAAFPASVSTLFGPILGIRVYGQVFTAWGLAGLLAPWTAGFLFEVEGDYTTPLLLAAGLAAASAVSIAWFPRAQNPAAAGR
jgi:OFA family oxalate/formate antiporter-like MFS transporter